MNDSIRIIEKFAHENDLKNIPCGSYQINDRIRVNVFEYETKDNSDSILEAHKINTDVHYVISGTEKILFCNVTECTENKPYDNKGDFALYFAASFDETVLKEGQYYITPPEIAHKAGVSVNGNQKVKKAVFKISNEA